MSRSKPGQKGQGGKKSRKPKYEETRREMDQVRRNLGVLEHLFLMVAAITSLIAGALVAWLLTQGFELPFRTTWAVASLVLFIVPGTMSYLRVRKEQRTTASGQQRRESETS